MIDSRIKGRMQAAKAYYQGRADMIDDIMKMLSEMAVQDQVADLFFRAGEQEDNNDPTREE